MRIPRKELTKRYNEAKTLCLAFHQNHDKDYVVRKIKNRFTSTTKYPYHIVERYGKFSQYPIVFDPIAYLELTASTQ